MDVGLGIAGLICVAMAVGHTVIGVLWVLPTLTNERLPRTPFGPPATTVVMVRVTWYIVTVFVLALGGLLLTFAWAPETDPKGAVLRSFSAMWLAATLMAFGVARRSPSAVLRLPVPFLWLVVGCCAGWRPARSGAGRAQARPAASPPRWHPTTAQEA